jgi:hypothetical protein
MRHWLLKDLGWKLFSLFLALTIWLTVHKINVESEATPAPAPGETLTFYKTVLVIASAADVRAFRVQPALVSITVRVSPEMLDAVPTNQVRAMVDLTDLDPARDLSRGVAVSTPPGMTLLSVYPATVQVLLPPKH